MVWNALESPVHSSIWELKAMFGCWFFFSLTDFCLGGSLAILFPWLNGFSSSSPAAARAGFGRTRVAPSGQEPKLGAGRQRAASIPALLGAARLRFGVLRRRPGQHSNGRCTVRGSNGEFCVARRNCREGIADSGANALDLKALFL